MKKEVRIVASGSRFPGHVRQKRAIARSAQKPGAGQLRFLPGTFVRTPKSPRSLPGPPMKHAEEMV
jgi:hypothetical protein